MIYWLDSVYQLSAAWLNWEMHVKSIADLSYAFHSGWFSKWRWPMFLFVTSFLIRAGAREVVKLLSPTLQTHWFCAYFLLVKDQKLCRVTATNCFKPPTYFFCETINCFDYTATGKLRFYCASLLTYTVKWLLWLALTIATHHNTSFKPFVCCNCYF